MFHLADTLALLFGPRVSKAPSDKPTANVCVTPALTATIVVAALSSPLGPPLPAVPVGAAGSGIPVIVRVVPCDAMTMMDVLGCGTIVPGIVEIELEVVRLGRGLPSSSFPGCRLRPPAPVGVGSGSGKVVRGPAVSSGGGPETMVA